MVELAHAASFRDEPFFCTGLSGAHANALAITTYPHRDGQHIRNLGRLGARWSVTGVWCLTLNGTGQLPDDYYPNGLIRFIAALEEKDRGQFDHVLFGRAWAQASRYNVRVSERHKETVFLDIEFEESNLDEPTYDLVLTDLSVTENGGEDRAAMLDAEVQALYPDLSVGVPFSDLWSAFMFSFAITNRILSYDDAILAVNTFHLGVTTTINTYPLLITSAVNWNPYSQITLLRRDANTIATRRAGEGKRITTWNNQSERSALEIVVELYNDTTREEEFLRLNNIKDPLFVPPGVYRVYSDFYPRSDIRAAI
jgi:prophage DNA circulation protein